MYIDRSIGLLDVWSISRKIIEFAVIHGSKYRPEGPPLREMRALAPLYSHHMLRSRYFLPRCPFFVNGIIIESSIHRVNAALWNRPMLCPMIMISEKIPSVIGMYRA